MSLVDAAGHPGAREGDRGRGRARARAGPVEPLVTTVQVPQEVLDAVAEAETDEPVGASNSRGRCSETAEAPAGPAAEAPAETPADDEEVSLEAILEDLKRREGRSG